MPTETTQPADNSRSRHARAFFVTARPGREERRLAGRAQRKAVPREAHSAVPDQAWRADALALLRAQESDREPDLVPLRYERMAADPFAFLRGSAGVMASDLAPLPRTELGVQLCGDAHVANFGMFASPERSLVFDVNDFDETLPGPFEWDVKRLAASAAVAALVSGRRVKHARQAATAAVRGYRETMLVLADLPTLDIWYARLDVDALARRLHGSAVSAATKNASRSARRRTAQRAADKLTAVVDGERRFVSTPPLLVPVPADERDSVLGELTQVYSDYLRTLAPDRVSLLLHYSFRDLARKVVGVGSVGTRALVMLLEDGDGATVLLQVKQAGPSVLESYLGASEFKHGGKRVVVGQKVMQAASDPFLGWCHGSRRAPFDFYVRQLRDMKGSIDAAALDSEALAEYAYLCGAVLARAHARSSDAAPIAGYLGRGSSFDEALGDFALAYADITFADHAALQEWKDGGAR